MATLFSEEFSPGIDDVEAYTRNQRNEYDSEQKKFGYVAGALGYESVSGSAQDFSRFISILLEDNRISEEMIINSKIYAKPDGHHPLVKGKNDRAENADESVLRYFFKDLDSEKIDNDISMKISNSRSKTICIDSKKFEVIKSSSGKQIHAILREIIKDSFNLPLAEVDKFLEETGIRSSEQASGAGRGVSGGRTQIKYLNKFVSYANENLDIGIDVKSSYLELKMDVVNPAFDNKNRDTFVESVFDALEKRKNVIVEGVAGSGKSHLLDSLRRTYYLEKGGLVDYWVAPDGKNLDSDTAKDDLENEKNKKVEEGYRSLYGEKGGRIEVVVFHPSTSYEEFVSGIRPNFLKSGEGSDDFITQEGIFIENCNKAAQNSSENFLLFIDEINRANTSRVFGDLMLVIEDSKRTGFTSAGNEDASKVVNFGALISSESSAAGLDYIRLQTPIVKEGYMSDGEFIELGQKEREGIKNKKIEKIIFDKLVVPNNLHILGTMNTTDRSVGTIDLALRRRFHWVTQEPMDDQEKILNALKIEDDKKKGAVGLVADWFIHANQVLKDEVGPDARLGHAYFFGKDGDAKVIADALIAQLLEIIFTFNIKKEVLEEIGLPRLGCYENKKLDYEGQGLGRRPVIRDLKSGEKPVATASNAEPNEDEPATDQDD